VSETSVEVKLEHARWRHAGWVGLGIVLGAVLVWKLGTVGKGVGVLLIGVGLYNVRAFVLTIIHSPGTIRIDGDQAELPRGLCRGVPVTVPISLIRHAFFLRRAVPWTRSGPLLVIETADRVFTYPREWFASDSDQRRVAVLLNRRLGR
jgi:hypothetical protein